MEARGLEKRLSVKIKVIFREEPEGGFTVIVPGLKGCITYGETSDEAKKNAKEAILLYLECLIEDHEPIPRNEHIEIVEIEVTDLEEGDAPVPSFLPPSERTLSLSLPKRAYG